MSWYIRVMVVIDILLVTYQVTGLTYALGIIYCLLLMVEVDVRGTCLPGMRSIT